MPPAFGDADDGRGDYNSDFKKKKVTLEGVMNGEPVPASWMSALGPGFKCSKLLGTGSVAVSSVFSLAKTYPRLLVVVNDQLLCCKLDEMEVCTYKWLKKLVLIARLRRLPRTAFSLTSTTEVSIEFTDLDPATGQPAEEVFSFAKPFEADRFIREVEETSKAARKKRIEEAEARDEAARRGQSFSAPAAAASSSAAFTPAPAPAPAAASAFSSGSSTPPGGGGTPPAARSYPIFDAFADPPPVAAAPAAPAAAAAAASPPHRSSAGNTPTHGGGGYGGGSSPHGQSPLGSGGGGTAPPPQRSDSSAGFSRASSYAPAPAAAAASPPPPPSPPSFNLFDPEPAAAARTTQPAAPAPPVNLLDEVTPPRPAAVADPFGFGGALAGPSPPAAFSMAPLAASLPPGVGFAPSSSPQRTSSFGGPAGAPQPKLGDTQRKPNDPFAGLAGLL